jgi:hypothetical protein
MTLPHSPPVIQFDSLLLPTLYYVTVLVDPHRSLPSLKFSLLCPQIAELAAADELGKVGEGGAAQEGAGFQEHV